MINNNMPRASSQGWTPMLDESPVCMLVDNNKNFFDFADVDILDNDDKEQAVPANLIVVEDFTLPTTEDMEVSYTVIDSTNILSLGGGTEGVEEEEEEDDASVDNRNIPTTALEMVNCETVPLSETQHASASFLSANLPAPLGTQPSPSPCPPTTTTTTTSSPFQLPCTPPYPHPPSTPSGYSTCSGDDVASTSSSEQLTPEVSGVTSGRKFLIPMPSDDRMAAAALSALETCSLTPLIKEELKYTIQSRRLAAGKPELVVDTKPPVKVQKVMTAEERERALKRREQNRMAAQRFRQKQRDTAHVLSKKCQRLEGSNSNLRAEIKRLARESRELRELLVSHCQVCPKVKVAR